MNAWQALRHVAWTVAVLAALAAPPAAAAPPWSDPAQVGGPGQAAPRLAFAHSGAGVVAFDGPGGTELARQAPDGRFGPAAVVGSIRLQDLTGAGPGQPDQLLGVGPRPGPDPRPLLLSGDARGGPFRSTPLVRAGTVAALAVSPEGDVAILVGRCPTSACSQYVPTLLLRRAGRRRFGEPITLGRAEVDVRGDVAIDATGRVLVAWARSPFAASYRRSVLARTRSSSGRLGPLRSLGSTSDATALSVALGRDGTAVLALTSQARASGGFTGRVDHRVAVAAPGRPLRRPRLLERIPQGGGELRVPGPKLILLSPPRGRPQLLWTGSVAGRWVIRATDVGRHGPLRSQLLSESSTSTFLTVAAVDGRGAVVAAGIRLEGIGDDGDLVAFPRPPSAGAFGPLELVAGSVSGAATTAFDPSDGRPVAAWLDADERIIATSSRDPLP